MLLACLFCALVDAIADWRVEMREQRITAAEDELNRAQQQLRQAVLHLAEELVDDRKEASKAMTRATFLTTGTVPTRPS